MLVKAVDDFIDQTTQRTQLEELKIDTESSAGQTENDKEHIEDNSIKPEADTKKVETKEIEGATQKKESLTDSYIKITKEDDNTEMDRGSLVMNSADCLFC